MLDFRARVPAAGLALAALCLCGCGSSSTPDLAGADGAAAMPRCQTQGAGPTLVGPLPAARPGDRGHNYPWNAADTDLAAHGYVEEEYFLCGNTPIGPYTTRLLVRRPKTAAAFNGAAVVEWLNVTTGRDLDVLWLSAHQHLMQRGYAYVGVTAQRVGLDYKPGGFIDWSPRRYAQLAFPQGGSLDQSFVFDPASYAIYGQALGLVKHPGVVDPLGGLPARTVIATGASQSAGALTLYYDLYQRLDGAADGFLPLLLSASSLLAALGYENQLNVDFPTLTALIGKPVFLLNTETDPSFLRLPDSGLFRLWEVAGATHIDENWFQAWRSVIRRDLGTDLADGDQLCQYAPRSRIPFRYAIGAALDHLLDWIRNGTPPPRGVPFQYDALGQLVRDGYGNVLGGIRLPQQAVPAALNSRENTALDRNNDPFCELYGRHQGFDAATLHALYPSHADYVSRVQEATQQNLRDGYIGAEDAQATIEGAQSEAVPP